MIFKNPFQNVSDHHAQIWEILMQRDIFAFTRSDWDIVKDDFEKDKFFGTHANFSDDPLKWTLAFPSLKDYRESWLCQAHESAKKSYCGSLEERLHHITSIGPIKLVRDKAIIWKKFDGLIKTNIGETDVLRWQTIYFCQLIRSRWKIISFIGYLPLK